jgi:hypothetical protein
MCAESPEKYNVMFAVQFQAECNLRADKRHVKEIERVMTLILGRRSEMSTFNVSTADAIDVRDEWHPYVKKTNMPMESQYNHTVSWTSMPKPVYVKVAIRYDGSVEGFLDMVARLEIYCRKRTQHCQYVWWRTDTGIPYGWSYINVNGQIQSGIIGYKVDELIQTSLSDKQYVYRVVDDIRQFVNQLFGKEYTKEQILNWAVKRHQNKLNEDFLDNTEIELQKIEMSDERPDIFRDAKQNLILIVGQSMLSEESPNIGKLLTLTDRLRRSLKLFERNADAYLAVDDYGYKTYAVPEHELIIRLTGDEMSQMPFAGDGFYIIMRTNLPKNIAKYYDMMHSVFALLDVTYGAFRPTVSVYALIPSHDAKGYKNIHQLHPRYNSDVKDVSTPDELRAFMDDTYIINDYCNMYSQIYKEQPNQLIVWQEKNNYVHQCFDKNCQ